MSAFFCKSSISWQKEYLYSKQKYENCVRNFLVLFSDFVNVSFKDYACGIRLPDCSKLDINWKKDSDITIFQHDAIVKFFNVILFLLSCLVSLYFYKGLTRNSEIGNTPVWVLPSICILGQVRDTKFGIDVSNKIWLMLQNASGIAFTNFEFGYKRCF